MKRLTLLLISLSLTSCIIYRSEPAKPGTLRAYREHRAACRRAYEIGWCVTGCKRQPLKCSGKGIQRCIGCGSVVGEVEAPVAGAAGRRSP